MKIPKFWLIISKTALMGGAKYLKASETILLRLTNALLLLPYCLFLTTLLPHKLTTMVINGEKSFQQIKGQERRVPVRKVSNRGGNIIGRFPSFKLGRMVDFESLIERDLIFLLDFEPEVETFCEQPLTIEYQDEGKVRHYTPDFHAIKKGRNILMECKPEKFVQTAKNQRKFRAGQSWCATRGWIYQLVTDQDLYSGYRLQNIKHLTQFARYSISPAMRHSIRTFLLATSAPVTIAEVMVQVAPQAPQSVQIPCTKWPFTMN